MQSFFLKKLDILLNLLQQSTACCYTDEDIYTLFIWAENKYKPILKLHDLKYNVLRNISIVYVIVNVRKMFLLVLSVRSPPFFTKSCYIYDCAVHVSKYLISIYVKLANSLYHCFNYVFMGIRNLMCKIPLFSPNFTIYTIVVVYLNCQTDSRCILGHEVIIDN